MYCIYCVKKKVCALLCLISFAAHAQNYIPTENSQKPHLKKLIQNVEVNPSNLEAHHVFISAFNLNDPKLEEQYKIWIVKFPKIYNVPFTIGQAFVKGESPKAFLFLSIASKINPNDAEVWSLLADDALYTNNLNNRVCYLKKAVQLAPSNPKYAFDYAYLFKSIDPAKYDSLSLEVIRNFPNTEQSAHALYSLAINSTLQSEKIAYFKQFQNGKINQNSEWYLSAMTEYYDLLLKTNAEQAFELGLTLILNSKRNLNIWKDRIKVAKGFLKSKELLEKKKPEEALSLLNKIDLGSLERGNYVNAWEQLELFKAEAIDESKNTTEAYDRLSQCYSNTPTLDIQSALYRYGRKLGLDSSMVMKNIYKIRGKKAIQASDFSLINYLSNKKTSLMDYAGKVMLLTYWFPGCGPCRSEFPYIESVLKKFNRDEVVYLGLNLEPTQDEFVLPFLKKTCYTFIPLHDNKTREKGNLKAEEAPTNYLIDQKGRILFSNFRISASNEMSLELMIKETLASQDN